MDAPVPALEETDSFFEKDLTDKPQWLRVGEGVRRRLEPREVAGQSAPVEVRRRHGGRGDAQDPRPRGGPGHDRVLHLRQRLPVGRPRQARARRGRTCRRLQVPFFMRWPGWVGHPGNETDNAPRRATWTSHRPCSMPRTSLRRGGDQKDGRTLLDVSNPRKRILTEVAGGFSRAGRWSSIHTADLHYTETYGINPDGTTDFSDVLFREYYDLTRDPLELTNLLADNDLQNDPPTQELAAAVANDRTCAGATCPRGGEQIPLEAKITRGAAEDDFQRRRQHGRSRHERLPQGRRSTSPAMSRAAASSAGSRRSTASTGGSSWRTCWSPTTYSPFVNGPYRFSVRADRPRQRRPGVADRDVSVDRRLHRAARYRHRAGPAAARDQPGRMVLVHELQAGEQVQVPARRQPAVHALREPGELHRAGHAGRLPARTEGGLLGRRRGGPDACGLPLVRRLDSAHREQLRGRHALPTDGRRSSRSASSGPRWPARRADEPSRFECKLDDEEYEPCGQPNGESWERTYPGLSKGAHELSVRVLDQVGNPSAPVTHQWTTGDAHTFRTTPDTRWPDVVGTEVRSVISDGCGGWYVGGTFTGVGNNIGFSNVAHIAANKTVDATWVPIVTGGGVRCPGPVGQQANSVPGRRVRRGERGRQEPLGRGHDTPCDRMWARRRAARSPDGTPTRTTT